MTAGRARNLEDLDVLVIDDNKHMLMLIGLILNGLRIKKVRTATDAAVAFREMRQLPPDLVICDWNMQPLDGLDFVRLIRRGQDSPNPLIPIIMLTGHTEMYRVIEARDAGVNGFLAKPVSPRRLYDAIIAAIEDRRPFIRTDTYFGPDRRFGKGGYDGPERRKSPPKPATQEDWRAANPADLWDTSPSASADAATGDRQ